MLAKDIAESCSMTNSPADRFRPRLGQRNARFSKGNMYTGKKKDDAGDKDAPRAKAPDAREGHELKDAVHKPISCHPQTNRRRTHAEPVKLNRR